MRVSVWFALFLLLSGVLLQHNTVLAQTNTPPTLTSIGTINGAFEDSSFYVQGFALFNNANEADADGNALTFRVEEVLSGTLKNSDGTAVVPGSSTVASNQTLTWTPPGNANGVIAAFTIVAFDGTDVSSPPVTVNISVAPFDDTPTLDPFPQSTTIAEDSGPLVVNLTGITAGAPDENQPLTVTATVKGATGAPSTLLAASIDYTSPQSTGTLTLTPATNQFGSATVTVTVSDGHTPSPNYPRTDTRSFNVTVTSVNDAPTLDALPDLTINEDSGPVTVDLSGITSGASNENQILSVTASIAYPPYILTSPTIPVTYTSPQTTGKLTLNLIANASGSAPVSVRVYDGGITTTRTFNLTVTAVNDPPTLTTMNPLRSTNEDQPYNVVFNALTFEGNEADVDGPSMNFRIEQVLSGTMTQNGQPIVPGQTLVTSTTSVLWTPPANEYGDIAAFTVRAWDGIDASATPIIVPVRVNSINDVPAAQPQTLSGNEDTPIPFTLPNRDVDGDAVTYTFFDLNGATVSGTAPNFTYTSALNRNGAVFFTFRASDGVLTSNYTRIDVNLTAVNDPPTLTTMNPLRSTNEDQAYTVTYSALTFEGNEADVDGPSLSFRIEQVLTGTMLQNGQPIVPGQTFVASNTTVVWIPPANEYGDIAAFTVRAWDGTEASATPVIVPVRVISVNDPPPAQTQTLNTDEDTPVNFILPDRDVDGDTLTYTFTELNGATVTGTAPNFTYTPPLNRYGNGSFVFRSNDGVLSSYYTRIYVNVASVNDAPTLTTVAPLSGIEDSVRYIHYMDITQNADQADDGTGGTLVFRVEEILAGTLTVGNQGVPVVPGETLIAYETLVWTPPLNANGLINAFTIKAWDGALASATAVPVPIQVAPRNDEPVAQTFSGTTPEDTALNFTPNATDVDGDTLTFTIVQTPDPSKGTITGTSPNFTFTPAPDFVGTAWFVYSVSDGTVTVYNIGGLINVTAVNDAPIAHPALVTADEDTFKSINLAASDAENDDLTFTIVEQPQHGFLDGVAPNVVYVPNANYNGPDSFSFKASDGTQESNIATVSITVTSINDAPWVESVYPIGNEDTQISVTLNGSDIDGDALTYTIVNPPQHGSISGTAPNLTYTPDADYHGADIFTYKANDGTVDSNLTIVAVTVEAVNDAPTAASAIIEADEDTAKALTLGATDIDGDALTYSVVAAPAHGSISGTAPNLTYTPDANYNGSDSFTFKVNDGTVNSAVATITINVAAVNDAPTLTAIQVLTGALEDETAGISYAALQNAANEADVDNVNIAFRVESLGTGTLTQNGQPVAVGTIINAGDGLEWTPPANANGTLTAFSVKAWDGQLASAQAIAVKIQVDPVSDAPVANNLSVSTDEDVAVNIALTGSDVDGDTLTYSIVQAPQHGSITGTAPNLIYTPDADYNGTDSFTFIAGDGALDSVAATVNITIAAKNDSPVAQSQSASTNEDEAKTLTLGATDVDGDALTYSIVQAPPHGTLSGTAPNLTYTPHANYNGADSFTFRVNDGSVNSNTATVSLNIVAQNDAPTATAATISATEDTAKTLTLSGSDIDGDALAYAIVAAPAHGTLSGTAPNLTYTPAANYNGADSFTFKVNDGAVDSAAATITLNIAAVNDAPVAQNGSATTGVGTAVGITLNAADVDGNTLTYTIVSNPTRGTLSGSGAQRTYTPNAGFTGTDTFTFRANDGTVNSNVATVTITVQLINRAPVLTSVNTLTGGVEDTSFTITYTTLAAAANESDPDGNTVRFRVESVASGTLTKNGVAVTPGSTLLASGESLVWKPAADNNGTLTAFGIRAWDGSLASASEVPVKVSVTAVNDAPSFTLSGTNITVAKNAAAQTRTGWAINLSDGPADESSQTLSFVVSNNNTSLFSSDPVISSNGTLTFTPAKNKTGTATVSVRVQDSGGTTNGGVNTSATQTFTIKIN